MSSNATSCSVSTVLEPKSLHYLEGPETVLLKTHSSGLNTCFHQKYTGTISNATRVDYTERPKEGDGPFPVGDAPPFCPIGFFSIFLATQVLPHQTLTDT